MYQVLLPVTSGTAPLLAPVLVFKGPFCLFAVSKSYYEGWHCGAADDSVGCDASVPFVSIDLSLAAQLPIQVTANAPRKTAEDGLSIWATATCEGGLMEL